MLGRLPAPLSPTASQTSSPTLSVIAQSDHLTGFSEHFVSYTPYAGNEKIWIADGSLALIAGKGQIVIFDGFSLQNVLHVPKLSYNLLSISKITRELHCKATFLPKSICFQDLNSGRTIGTARHSGGLYILNDNTSGSSISTTSLLSSYFSTSEHDFMLWHFRLGHPNFTYMKYLFPHLFPKIDVSSLSCDVCIRAKQHRVSFPSQPYKPTQPFTLIHIDVWGPSKVTTSSRKRWFVTFIETIPVLPGSTLSQINPSDNGREFQNHNLGEFLASKGIVHQTSCAYTPQQNGVAERKNCHLMEVARSLMLSTSFPSYLWGDAIVTAAHLINRMSSRILHLQTPLDCLKESYPSTRLVSEGESVSEESNSTFEFIEPTSSTVSDVDPHPIILPPNQVPWKSYYRRNLIKEVGSPTSQPPAPVQDFEPPRDQGMENPTEPCTNNTMSENDKSDVAVLENMEEKNRGGGSLHEPPRQDLKPNLVSRFTIFVKSQGYSQGHSDHTLFTKVSKTGKIAILIVYVDDIVLTGDDQTVTKSKEGISVSQRKYTFDLLTETGMLGCRPADTPIEFNCKLGNSDDQIQVDKEQYQRLVGKLIYLSHTRPNISFAVSAVSQFMQAPYEKYMEVVNRILRFLKNTSESLPPDIVPLFGQSCNLEESLVSLHQECETPLKLFCDNKAAIGIANNPVQYDRTKHVEIDRHFIKERLDNGSICIPYIPSSQQVADVLTMGLLKPHFSLCVSKLGLIDIYVPTLGGVLELVGLWP
ncbi:Beta-galactosidase [Cucumis melo var. makuwa]|uniref:Beta-galactosidase n=1 Tax=Cucumis melo var. makuwa TaxID=1194695 RepID=A0A5D3CCR1_CUCMM|nr:Beta-galactosidase [Cucumis melo var. makuwa]TYK09643.1 Beta-galactosidase [Cucumis melo var. makuwa]